MSRIESGPSVDVGRRHEERAAGIAETVDDADHLVLGGAGHLADLAQPAGPADAPIVDGAVGERLKRRSQIRCSRASVSSAEGLLGVARQRLRHAADGLVVGEIEGRRCRRRRCPWSQVRIRACCRIGSWSGSSPTSLSSRCTSAGRDLATADGHRAGDRLAQLVAGQPRHQVLAVVDRLGQVGELRAVAEEVRAHGEHDVDRHRLVEQRRLEQQRTKAVASSAPTGRRRGGARKRKISSNWSTTTSTRSRSGRRGLPHRVDQTQGAAAQGGLERARRLITASPRPRAAGPPARRGPRPGCRSDRRRAARAPPARRTPAPTIRPPCRAGISPERTSDDLPLPEVPTTARKRVAAQPVDQLVDRPLAAEEEVVFVGLEGAQPGERVGGGGWLGHRRLPLAQRSRSRNGSRSGSASASPRSTSASRVRSRSLAGDSGGPR